MKAPTNFTCTNCGKPFVRDPHNVNKNAIRTFCNRVCFNAYQTDPNSVVTLPCGQCGKLLIRSSKEQKASKSGHVFCNRSCAAKYNNAHKTWGCRRAKLEVWLEEKLREQYPDLDLYCNRRDAINAELDFYFPSLKLAFELNGILHYEPIYGVGKLEIIQTNDARKMLACAEHGIELCVVDTNQNHFLGNKGNENLLSLVSNILSDAIQIRTQLGWDISSTDPTRGYLNPQCTQIPVKPKKRPGRPRIPKVPIPPTPSEPHYRATVALTRAFEWNRKLQAGDTWRGLSKSEGVSQMMLAKYLRFLHLPKDLQKLILDRDPSTGRMSLAYLTELVESR